MNENLILDDFDENQPNYSRYASFWERLVAVLIDGILIFVIGQLLAYIGLGIPILDRLNNPLAVEQNPSLALMGSGLGFLFNWLYFAFMESSPDQSTLGKRAMGLRVLDTNGDQISFLKATGRFFGKNVSAIILLIGYLMQPFTERKQALHDMMAGTLVVKN